MKKVDVVLGLQWGDEGKGKVVDVLTPAYRVIARFQGGPNAGHSLHFEGKKYVLHTIPSGIFRDGSVNVIGNGVVIDPVILSEEIAGLEADGIDVQGKLLISKKAHLILPTHRAIDAASEAAKGKTKIGSTLKGIGPTYMDKTGRNGLRIGDIVSPEFGERYGRLKEKHLGLLRQYDYPVDLTDYEKKWFEGIENLKRFRLIDSEHVVNRLLDEDNTMLAEGAQGSMLDIDFGTYPFVTSSNTLCAGVCTGLGVAPSRIGNVYGIFKAYCTRVGSGPFPTELFDEDGERMRQIGMEFGATTGPPLRLARHGRAEVLGHDERSHVADHDESRRAERFRPAESGRSLPRERGADDRVPVRDRRGNSSGVQGVRRVEMRHQLDAQLRRVPPSAQRVHRIHRAGDGRAGQDYFGRSRPRRNDCQVKQNDTTMRTTKGSMTAMMAAALLTTGCAAFQNMSKTGQGATIGGGGGAVAGAAIGAMAGGGKGAAIGTAVGAGLGAGVGALIGRRMDKQKAELEKIEGAQVETVTDENDLQAIKVTFNDKILFATGKSDLSDASRSALGKFAASLAQSPETDIAIYGHTDNTGSRAVNQKLSEERAQAVANYLIGQKVDPVRITTRGLAYASPIADNSTEEGRAQNRRVEILITANDQMIQQAQDGTLK